MSDTKQRIVAIFPFLLLALLSAFYITTFKHNPAVTEADKKISNPVYPLMVSEMRKKSYPGSEIIIEQELGQGINYKSYLSFYKSERLKIYGLLTVPIAEKPKEGYPAIVFNHGYIPPEQYRTTEKYTAYLDGFAHAGYVVFKPDYRGHGNSEGQPEGAYYSPAYTTDVLNAVFSVKKLKEVNPQKIGMWGHSLGGNLTLRSMVVSSEIKAGVIWAGVVGNYEDLFFRWRRSMPWQPSSREAQNHISSIRQQLASKFGQPNNNSQFWKSIDPYNFLKDVSGPIQLHQGTLDETVPPLFSEHLKQELKKNGKTVEYYTYDGADHNLSQGFNLAMKRSVEFFDKYLKN